ncbi:MAG: mechanosensitive ion channel family protein [Sciscionella sp.]
MPECASESGTWCAQVWQSTHVAWLASSADWLIAKPIRIVLILLVAFLVRLLLRRLINRAVSGAGGAVPAILKPLREHAPEALGPLTSARRAQRAKTVGSLLKSVVSFVLYGIAFTLVLGELGVNLAPIIASAGVVGIALGFGAQNLVRDFLSGMFMMLEDQYGVGDVIDVGEASGTVEAVGLRVTTLRDVNGTVWYVRNGEVLRVGNSSQGHAVAVIDLPVGHDADVEEAIELLGRVSGDAVSEAPLREDVLAAPEVLGVEQMTAEGLVLRVTVRVRAGRQWAVQRALRARLKAALNDAGVQPPLFGQQHPQAT